MHAYTRPVLASLLLLILLLTAGTASAVGSLSGRVTEYGSGVPLPGIELYLFRGLDPNDGGKDAWIITASALTDANGEYHFGNLEPRQYHISTQTGASSIGKRYVRTDLYNLQVLDNVETPNMDLQLHQAGFIWGYVRTESGAPIADATVYGHAEWMKEGPGWHRATTDDTGRYQIWLLPSPGEFYVVTTDGGADWVNLKGYEAAVAPGLYQGTIQGTHGPDFVLAEGGCITGRVVNGQGVGIPGVEIWPQIGVLERPRVTTDESGWYFLGPLPATDLAYAHIQGLRPILLDGVKYGSGQRFVGPLTITPGSCTEAPDMQILQAGTIEGVVTDTAGTPIVGAEIEIQGFDTDGYELDEGELPLTGALGQYTLDYLPPGEYSLRAIKDGWVMTTRSSVIVVLGEQTELDLVMRRAEQGVTVFGRIIDFQSNSCQKESTGILLPHYLDNGYETASEEICQNGIVAFPSDYIYRAQEPLMLLGFGDIDDGYADYFLPHPTEQVGDYRLALPPGNVDALLYSYDRTDRGEYLILNDRRQWSLAEGETLAGQDFRLPTINGSGVVEGVITYPPNTQFNPRMTAVVAINEQSASNSTFGDAIAWPDFAPTYRIGHLPAGRYTLRVLSQGFVDQTYENVLVSDGATTVQNIALDTGATLSGAITDAATGLPVAAARLEFSGNSKTGVSDAAGAYRIAGLAPNDYNLHVTKPGYADFNGTVTVTLPTTNYDIALDSLAGSIAGQVVDENAAAVNDARVVAYNPALDSHRSVTTVGGGFIIEDLPAGDYVLGISAPGYATVQYPPSGTLSLSPDQILVIAEPIPVTPNGPLFGSTSTVSDAAGVTTLSVTLTTDLALPSAPVIASRGRDTATGCATFTWQQVTADKYVASCEVAPGESLVWIDISEGTVAVIPGNPASATFSFEVASNLLNSSTTNFYNAIGGDSAIMGKQDNSQVYVPPFALTGAETQAVPLTVKRYGNPGDTVAGTDDQATSAVYDFFFEDDEVRIDTNHEVTITLQFEKPENLSQAAFEADLKIGFFRVSDQKWVFHTEPDSGIGNLHINWLNSTVTFEASHFTRFAAFLPAPPSLPGDYDGDGDVDRDDLDILMQDRNKHVNESNCGTACDLDGDGTITVLDARKLFLLCSRTRCATE